MSRQNKLLVLGIVAAAVIASGFYRDSYASMNAFGILVASWLSLAIFSFLYRDNPFYKFAEHLFVGIAAGYGVAVTFWQMIMPNLVYKLVTPSPELTGQALRNWKPELWLVVPLFFGLLFFTRWTTNWNHFVRWSLAFLIGGYAGVKLTGHAHTDLVAQAGNTMLPIFGIRFFPAFPWLRAGEYGLNHLLIVVGVVTTLSYFFFSRPHRGALGAVARVGIVFLMVAFGASFGYTVMARVSLLIGRLMFLLQDWLQWVA